MKVFALVGAMLIYISVAMQNAVKVINYPAPGIQLPEVRIYASSDIMAHEMIASLNISELN